MVGEIRDLETAQIAVQAALTGHLVLSTLHTNSAAATITRLRDMGLEDYLLTAVLRGVLAQRLVRRLCRAAGTKRAPPELVARLRAGPPRARVGRSRCGTRSAAPQCRDTGYRGRLAIAEFLRAERRPSSALIFAGAEHAEIERAAVAAGMVPMFDAGLQAALEGLHLNRGTGRAASARRAERGAGIVGLHYGRSQPERRGDQPAGWTRRPRPRLSSGCSTPAASRAR